MPKEKKKRTPVKTRDFGTSSRELRSQTLARRKKDEQDERLAAQRLAQELQKQRDSRLANRAPAVDGNLSDGNFHMAFVQMGQGDCAIMATPAGRVVIIDCGSSSREEPAISFDRRVSSVLLDAKFLKSSDVVDALILTHSDKDHYNNLSIVLPKNISVQNVYHSDKCTTYSLAETGAWLLSHVVDINRIFAVDHHMNGGAAAPVIRLNETPVEPATDTEKINRSDGDGGIRIIDEPNCKISLLASNVNTLDPPDHSTEKNRGSVVTLVEVFGEKLLVCGDATFATERYVLNQHRARITNVTLAQAGHHGSARTSSSDEYVQCVNPKLAVISAGRTVDGDNLPSYDVIDRYIRQMTRATAIHAHEIYYWHSQGLADGFVNDFLVTTSPLYVTGSWTTYYYTIRAPGGGA